MNFDWMAGRHKTCAPILHLRPRIDSDACASNNNPVSTERKNSFNEFFKKRINICLFVIFRNVTIRINVLLSQCFFKIKMLITRIHIRWLATDIKVNISMEPEFYFNWRSFLFLSMHNTFNISIREDKQIFFHLCSPDGPRIWHFCYWFYFCISAVILLLNNHNLRE